MSQPRILRPEDATHIVNFEKSRLEQTQPDEMERELLSWHASWREESLQHYLPLGWSFGLWSDDGQSLVGYFLAQPFLFMRGLTQTLWVERLVAQDARSGEELIEIAYKLSREKHFQKVLFYLNEDAPLENSIFQLSAVSDNLVELKTAKF
jgi:hypothetical protein